MKPRSEAKTRINPFSEAWRTKNASRHSALKAKMKLGKGKSHITGNIYSHE